MQETPRIVHAAVAGATIFFLGIVATLITRAEYTRLVCLGD
jgi:hypothetical protein